MKTSKLYSSKGQALIVILVTSSVALIVLSAAAFLSIHQLKTSLRNRLSQEVYYAAEAGAEEALMRMIRKNPTQASTCSTSTIENLSINSINVTVNYLPLFGGCVVFSTAQKDSIVKKIQVFANLGTYNTTKVFPTGSWTEVLP
jgi:hypothetical protein